MRERPNSILSRSLPDRIHAAIKLLIDAHESAMDVERDPWDFAVEIQFLREIGLSTTEFRWLSCKGLVLHCREIGNGHTDARRFEPENILKFTDETCFVVTEEAFAYLRDCHDRNGTAAAIKTVNGRPLNEASCGNDTPAFDRCNRELTFLGHVIKRFKLPSPNQETVLIAFEEDGWPRRIDDPLPPRDELDPKQRLHDTIKCLNRRHVKSLIRFRGDGTGRGVFWRTH